ncbi:hypothetical protein [Actinokineospora terrae]|uniref:Uncharacterized protein n=1 Tax=Actinokineospora terrae TaxID=155974 RepID=A0A1H9T3N7_9PSEU|nr:hypothetical protein [Actinokineospora terrae]SER91614.1 hypothetical protein SAMN04487818_10649 [Actinokineospora terrae]
MFDDRPPDATVHYRHTNAGVRVAVLPATCKVGIHSLHAVGYKARVDQVDGVVRISCDSCAEAPDVDHFWVLRTTGAIPDLAELDDEPYRHIVPLMIDPRGRRFPSPVDGAANVPPRRSGSS